MAKRGSTPVGHGIDGTNSVDDVLTFFFPLLELAAAKALASFVFCSLGACICANHNKVNFDILPECPIRAQPTIWLNTYHGAFEIGDVASEAVLQLVGRRIYPGADADKRTSLAGSAVI